MSLNKATLKTSLLAIIDGSSFPATSVAAGTAWANAYDGYALDADSCGSIINPPSTSAALPGLKTAWGTALASGTSTLAAGNLTIAIAVYWPLVTFPGDPPLSPGSPPVVSTPGFNALLVALQATFNTGKTKSADTVAGEIADAFDAYTKTVVVTHINSPPTIPTCIDVLS